MSWTSDAPSLAALDPEARATLDRLAPMEVPAGQPLFHPGDVAQGFVVMISGRVDVFLIGATGRDILLYSVEPGQSCVQTTLGLLGGEAYSGEAVAHEPSRLVLIPRTTFLTLMDQSAAFRNFVFQAFAARMHAMMHLLDKVAFQRLETRLAELLLTRAPDDRLTATHAELAAMVGSSREVVSRRLDALARRGILELGRGSVTIRDRATLEQIARDTE